MMNFTAASRRFLSALSLLAAASAPFACRGENTVATSNGDGDLGDVNAGGGGNETGITDTPFALDDADDLFNSETVPVFSVSVTDERWAALNADPAAETYEEGQLTFNGTEIGPVGIRYKGSFGSLVGCLDANNNLTVDCAKLSFKLKFSEIDVDQRFFRMKRLNFHGMARDRSKLHDKISYKVYRDAGIVAPRSTWARLEVNGESLGLFALVEQIDGRFTANRWPDDADGNLYKEAWPDSEDPDYYVEKLKTNEDIADVAPYVAFSTAMNASAPGEYQDTLSGWADLEQLYTYIAVSDTVANWDGITSFYCSEFGCGNHNFYMYESESRDHFTLVPWDLDSTLSPSTPADHVPHWTNPGDCDVRYSMFGGWVETMSAGCNNVFIALASERERYETAIDEVLGGPFDVDQIRADIDDYVAFISDEIANDPALDGVESWMTEVERLKDDLALLKLRAEAFRDGQEITPLAFSPTTPQDFESANELQVTVGTNYWISTGSEVTFSLNDSTPLGGSQDVRADFIYRDDGDEPWSQWLGWFVNVEPQETDFSGHTGIRLTVLADQDRTVRLDLESPHQPGSEDGARLGWEFTASSTATTFDLAFADAAIPTWATSSGEQLDEVLTQVISVLINPGAIRGTNGLIGEGAEDAGFFQVDDIEIY